MAWPGSTTQLTQRSNSIAEVPRLKKNEWELPEGHERARLVTNAQGRSRTRKAGPTPQTKRVGTPSLRRTPICRVFLRSSMWRTNDQRTQQRQQPTMHDKQNSTNVNQPPPIHQHKVQQSKQHNQRHASNNARRPCKQR